VLRRVSVLALGTRRGPPAEARLLYDEPEPPQPLRATEAAAWESLFADEEGDAA
jgi:ribosomal 50S subunit-recycling heat shock protein